MHGCKRKTRVDAPAVDVHRTSPALAMVAAFFRPGETESVAQRIEQGRAWVDRQRDRLSVDGKGHLYAVGVGFLTGHKNVPFKFTWRSLL